MCLNENLQGTWHIVFSSNFPSLYPHPLLPLYTLQTKPEVLNTLFHCCQQWQKNKEEKEKEEKKIIRQGKNIPWRNKLISLIFL